MPLAEHSALKDNIALQQALRDINALTIKVNNLRKHNDDLMRETFNVSNRTRQFVVDLGFECLGEAEAAINAHPEIWNRTAAEAAPDTISALEQQKNELSSLLSEAQRAAVENMKEIKRLRAELRNARRNNVSGPLQDKENTPPSGAKTPRPSLKRKRHSPSPSKSAAALQAELLRLQQRYDEVVSVKERAGEWYKTQYKKWRNFKEWLVEGCEEGEDGHLTPESMGRVRFRKKLVVADQKRKGLDNIPLPPDRILSHEFDIPDDVKDERASPLIPPPLRTSVKRTAPATPLRASAAPRVLAADSSAPELGSSPTQGRILAADSSASVIFQRSPIKHEPVSPSISVHLRRRRGETQPDASDTEDETQSPHVAHLKRNMYSASATVVQSPSKVRKFVPLTDVSHAKKKASPKGGIDPENTTINALYTINTARNGGLNYQYDTVVRNREERSHMDAGDCECCRDYYNSVGPLPSRLQPPRWRSPSSSQVETSTHRHTHAHEGASASAAVARHKQEISRHRHNWGRAPTPPGYWDIGFPTTQEADGINERAKEMHRQKMETVAREARHVYFPAAL